MSDVKQFRLSSYIITMVGLVAIIGPYAADWNETHIFNENWPPQAKFHNAQTMLLGSMLGIGSIWYSWKKTTDTQSKKTNISIAVFLAAVYWMAQSISILFPETAFIDPQFGATPRLFGIPGQLALDMIVFLLLLVAYYAANRTLKRMKTNSNKKPATPIFKHS
ncbi:MAG: hypothetical protein H7Y86_15245 [Rhizobacter sp.]|nr:hypothetical protein [Ferruginibacter sp.]